MPPLEQIHPMVVHFPIALLIASVIFDILSRVTGIERLSTSSTHTMIFGILSGYIAIIFGLIAFLKVVDVYKGVEEIALTHASLGIIVVIFFTMLIGMRGGFKWGMKVRGSIADLAYSIVGVLLLIWVAYLGAKMVYEHGVAVNKQIIKEEYILK